MTDKIYDLIIIGAGPAGITAAVYAARKRMDFIVITKDIGGQTAWTSDIENYTGYQFISGAELVRQFQEHISKYAIRVLDENVTGLEKPGDKAIITTGKGTYYSKAAIIASGKRSRELGVAGEKEFKNRGVSYCATCDGPLFAGRDIALIGGGNSALSSAIQMLKISRHVYIINNTQDFSGDAMFVEKIKLAQNKTIFHNSYVNAIKGDKFVNQVVINTPLGQKELSVYGVFVEIGLNPNTSFAKGVEKNEKAEIIIDCQNRTNIPGIFAAGDATSAPDKQIIIAAGEGAKAALSAFRYINSNPS